MTGDSEVAEIRGRDLQLAERSTSVTERVAGRTAQFLLGIPLGLFQLAAVVVFSLKGPMHGAGDWFVAVWGVVMSTTCAILASRILRSAAARRAAFAVLGAQLLFSVVKFTVYHESAALVFTVIIALTLAALFIRHRAVDALP